MAQLLNPYSGVPFLDSNGDPYVGAQLFVYEAGTSTKYTTTKDSAGVSNHANPIILNNEGVIADGSGAAQAMWQSAGQSVKLVLAPAGDTDPPVSPIRTYDNIPSINDTTDLGQWASGPAPTYVDATNFTVTGDQTSSLHVGRRLRLVVTAGTVYGVITETAYTTLTTVTVLLDSGSLDSGLSEVSLSIITNTNHSIANTLIPYRVGPEMIENVSISATVATKALTIAVKQKDGTDPTSGTPSRVAFRSETITDGDYDIVEITSATSVVAPQGATLGYAGSDTAVIYVYLINNAGAAEIAIRSASKVDEGDLHSTTAIGTGSDSSGAFYSTTLRTSLPVRYLGRITITMGSVAGDWDNSPTQINLGEVDNEQDISSLTTNHIEGLELSIGTDTEHDIDISTGNVIDTATSYKMVVPTNLTKQIDATFSSGSNAGGMATTTTETGTFTSSGTAVTGVGSAFDTDFTVGDVLYSSSNTQARRIVTIGSSTSITLEKAFTVDVSVAENVQKNGLAPETTYYVILIREDTDGSIDAYFDVDSTAANIPTGYTNYASLGAVRTNTSSNITSGTIIHTEYIPKGRSGSLVKIDTSGALASTSTVDFAIDVGLYSRWLIKFNHVDPSATTGTLDMVMSQDGGEAFLGAPFYGSVVTRNAVGTVTGSSGGNAKWVLFSTIATASVITGTIEFFALDETVYSTNYTGMLIDGPSTEYIGGYTIAAHSYPCNYIRIQPSSGNFTTGEIELWGFLK